MATEQLKKVHNRITWRNLVRNTNNKFNSFIAGKKLGLVETEFIRYTDLEVFLEVDDMLSGETQDVTFKLTNIGDLATVGNIVVIIGKPLVNNQANYGVDFVIPGSLPPGVTGVVQAASLRFTITSILQAKESIEIPFTIEDLGLATETYAMQYIAGANNNEPNTDNNDKYVYYEVT